MRKEIKENGTSSRKNVCIQPNEAMLTLDGFSIYAKPHWSRELALDLSHGREWKAASNATLGLKSKPSTIDFLLHILESYISKALHATA
jgi:hypothetical protein